MSAAEAALRRRSAALLLGAAAGWAALELMGRHLPPGYSPQQVVWSRYAAHILFLLLMPWRRTAVWRTQRPGLQLLSSLCMLGMPICFVAGARLLPAHNVWAIFWVSPLLALALGAFVVGENATPRTWALSLVALAGTLLVFVERPIGALPALLWPLGMAFCFSLYLVLARLLRHETTESKLFYVALGVFVALTPAMPSLFVLPDLRAAVGMAAIGLIGLGSLFLIDRALESATVSTAAPVVFTVVLWSVGFEALLGAGGGRRAALGSVVVAAALAGQLRHADPPRPESDHP